LCINYFLLSLEATARLARVEVDKNVRGWEHSGDHAPVWTDLGVEPVEKKREPAKCPEDA
jgi:exodeoxyribonuclease-3